MLPRNRSAQQSLPLATQSTGWRRPCRSEPRPNAPPSKTAVEAPRSHANRKPIPNLSQPATGLKSPLRPSNGHSTQKQKTVFQNGGLNSPKATPHSTVLTRFDSIRQTAFVSRTPPTPQHRSAAAGIDDPKPKPSSARPLRPKQKGHRAGLGGFEGVG